MRAVVETGALERAPWRIVLTLIALSIIASRVSGDSTVTVFVNGLWFDGESFASRIVAVSNGRIVESENELLAADAASQIDLKGGFVVPAFGEAHHHTVAYVEDCSESFRRAGIFYAKVQAVDIETGLKVREKSASPETIDLALAMAGLTAPDAHPAQIGLRLFRDASSTADLDGRWVHLIESKEDLDAKWPAVLASKPDFIKIFLLNSELYGEVKREATFPMRYRGMNPRLVPVVVERAHRSGLRVSSHVRTAADFRTAVEAGADEIAHLPGFAIGPSLGDETELSNARLLRELDEPGRFRLTAADAERAAELGVVVVTTAGSSSEIPASLPNELEALYKKSISIHTEVRLHNLRLLKDRGVQIVIGSDAGEGNSVLETLGLAKLDVFTPTELLQMLSQDTPRMIFPQRRIGCLEVGCEASFLSLENNPLEDLTAIESVVRRFKQGHEILVD